MRGKKKDYEQEILTHLSNGATLNNELRKAIGGMESHYYTALNKLLTENKIKKNPGIRNKYFYEINPL